MESNHNKSKKQKKVRSYLQIKLDALAWKRAKTLKNRGMKKVSGTIIDRNEKWEE